MNKAKATTCARWNANRYGEPYVAVQANNGQWMCESLKFVHSAEGCTRYTFRVGKTGRNRAMIVHNPDITSERATQ